MANPSYVTASNTNNQAYQYNPYYNPDGTQTEAQRAAYQAYADEDKRRWEAEYHQKKSDIDQKYKIAKLQARTQAESNAIDRWYKEQQVQLAQQTLAENQRQFNTKTGYDLVSLAAGLTGPENYFKASNLARGVQATPGSSTFLTALQNNTRLSDYNAQAGVPERVTLDSLYSKLGGNGTLTGSASGGGNAAAPNGAAGSGNGAAGATSQQQEDDAYGQQIRGIGLAGAHKLGAGMFEQLTPDEQKLFLAGLGDNGFSPSTFMTQYARSRIGNRPQYANVA